MNLLPIIYTSLIIFTGFVVFVVTISYITYKVKERNRTTYSASTKGLTANYIDRQPVTAVPVQNNYDYSYEYQVRAMQNQTQNNYVEPKYSQQTAYNTPRQSATQASSYKSPKPRRTRVETPRNSKKNYIPSVESNTRNRTTSVGRGSRFDVLNNQNTYSGGGLAINNSNFNLLNYYADDEDVNFPPTYARVS